MWAACPVLVLSPPPSDYLPPLQALFMLFAGDGKGWEQNGAGWAFQALECSAAARPLWDVGLPVSGG